MSIMRNTSRGDFPLAASLLFSAAATAKACGAGLVTWLVVAILPSLVCAQDNLYSSYSQLPLNERYEQESLAPRLVSGLFEEIPEKEKKDIQNRNKAKRAAITEDKRRVEILLETGGDLNDPIIDSYFAGYVFPEMTQLGDQTYDKLSNLGNLRAEFLKYYLSSKVTGQTRQRFIDTICIPKLKEIYSDSSLHPAARLNAVYLLGLLDLAPGSRSPAVAPTPSATALDELVAIVANDSAEAFLKVGAWAGIQRHVEIDSAVGNQIAEAKKQQIKGMALQIIANSFAGQDAWESDLSYWMKRRSTQMLGFFKDLSTLPTLLDIMKSSTHGFWLRLDALEAIERLNPPQVTNELVESVGNFLSETLAAEGKWIQDEKQTLINDNLLFQDIDLELTGTDWNSSVGSAPSGGERAGGPGRSGGGRNVGGIEAGGAGAGAGAGLAGGPGAGDAGVGANPGGGSRFGGGGGERGRPAGGGGTAPEAEKKVVELPNYMLNVSRRRIKTLAFTGKRVLKPADNRGLHAGADADNKTKINKMVATLDQLLTDSNVGIVNLDARRTRRPGALEEEPATTESITNQLMAACNKAAEKLKATLAPNAAAAANPLGG
jgi:hypothetical protein